MYWVFVVFIMLVCVFIGFILGVTLGREWFDK